MLRYSNNFCIICEIINAVGIKTKAKVVFSLAAMLNAYLFTIFLYWPNYFILLYRNIIICITMHQVRAKPVQKLVNVSVAMSLTIFEQAKKKVALDHTNLEFATAIHSYFHY